VGSANNSGVSLLYLRGQAAQAQLALFFICRPSSRTCYNAGMAWEAVFYQDKQGNEPVKDFILGQPDGAIAEILHVLKLLRQFNITLGMPYVRKISR
jgi:hypothetical protein